MKIFTNSREYRSDFSQAYKHLYKEGELNYLTEILDSAQEGIFLIFLIYFNLFIFIIFFELTNYYFLGIPCLWVNSEKYSFSKEVLENGQKLFECFCNLLICIKTIYNQ